MININLWDDYIPEPNWLNEMSFNPEPEPSDEPELHPYNLSKAHVRDDWSTSKYDVVTSEMPYNGFHKKDERPEDPYYFMAEDPWDAGYEWDDYIDVETGIIEREKSDVFRTANRNMFNERLEEHREFMRYVVATAKSTISSSRILRLRQECIEHDRWLNGIYNNRLKIPFDTVSELRRVMQPLLERAYAWEDELVRRVAIREETARIGAYVANIKLQKKGVAVL